MFRKERRADGIYENGVLVEVSRDQRVLDMDKSGNLIHIGAGVILRGMTMNTSVLWGDDLPLRTRYVDLLEMNDAAILMGTNPKDLAAIQSALGAIRSAADSGFLSAHDAALSIYSVCVMRDWGVIRSWAVG